ncbi:MAG: UDP-galactopyranose/dTDP-fucopyranose mutase family protein [Candidatus Helarchaeota archaeon]
MKSKILIVGSGLFGSVLARELTDIGYKCHVIDKRDHIGGNCYTKNIDGINVHKYGPHIFHTSNKIIWKFLQKHTTINNFTLRPKLLYHEKIYSLPINLMTLNQLWEVMNPSQGVKKIQEETEHWKKIYPSPQNALEWSLTNVGGKITKIFFEGYSKKQWKKDLKDIPKEVLKRQIIRYTFDDNYFNDPYQGIPNYNLLFKNLTMGVSIDINTDYLADRDYWDKKYDSIIYSGPIDEFFNYSKEPLEWRSLRFEEERMEIKDFQGVAMMNYGEENISFTRIVEHKHFEFRNQDFTIITKEYPQDWEPGLPVYYPINNKKNQLIYEGYKDMIDDKKYIFGGRLGSYRYLNMDETIEEALKIIKKLR